MSILCYNLFRFFVVFFRIIEKRGVNVVSDFGKEYSEVKRRHPEYSYPAILKELSRSEDQEIAVMADDLLFDYSGV